MRIAAFALLLFAVQIASAKPPLAMFCDANSALGPAATAMGIGMLALAFIVALAFMFGQLIHEPRLTEWAKSTVPQIGSSVLIFIVVLLVVNIGCKFTMGEAATWAGRGTQFGSMTAYEAAFEHLKWGAEQTQIGIVFLRAKMGAYNIRATTTTFNSVFPMGALGESVYDHSGDYSISGVHGTLLQLNTSFLIAIFFQHFSLLLLTSQSGLLLVLLPFGLVLRCVPFFRGFGGALSGLVVAMYIGYPFMLAMTYLVLEPLAPQFDVGHVLSVANGGREMTYNHARNYEDSIEGSMMTYLWKDPDIKMMYGLPQLFMFTGFNFVRAILLPTMGLLVTAVLAKDLSKLFGEEIDANKLVQLV